MNKEYRQRFKKEPHVLGYPVVDTVFKNKNGSKFKVVGFTIPPNHPKDEPGIRIVRQLYDTGVLGEKRYYYTMDELLEKLNSRVIEIV